MRNLRKGKDKLEVENIGLETYDVSEKDEENIDKSFIDKEKTIDKKQKKKTNMERIIWIALLIIITGGFVLKVSYIDFIPFYYDKPYEITKEIPIEKPIIEQECPGRDFTISEGNPIKYRNNFIGVSFDIENKESSSWDYDYSVIFKGGKQNNLIQYEETIKGEGNLKEKESKTIDVFTVYDFSRYNNIKYTIDFNVEERDCEFKYKTNNKSMEIKDIEIVKTIGIVKINLGRSLWEEILMKIGLKKNKIKSPQLLEED